MNHFFKFTFALGLAFVSGQHFLTAQTAAAKEGPAPLAKTQSMVKGLLVMELGEGNYVGKASQMNCTALPSAGSSASSPVFNQEVGGDMKSALSEVVKHLTVKRGPLPPGYKIELAWEDKYGAKDGPSAAVACALMLDSVITGAEIDPHFAVTGDMNADGSVQPVGGVPDKIRGAARRDCTYVGVPESVEKDLTDSLLIEGPKAFWEIQVFTMKTFDDALALASAKKTPAMQEAIDKFSEIQKLLVTRKDPSLLSNPKVLERLQAIGKAAPNCLSAKLLLLYGSGKTGKVLSIRGSLNQIEKVGSELLKNTRQPKPEGLQADALASSISELNRIRTKLNPLTVPYADAIKDFGVEFRAIKNNPPRSPNEAAKATLRLKASAARLDGEADKLHSNKTVMEEVMK